MFQTRNDNTIKHSCMGAATLPLFDIISNFEKELQIAYETTRSMNRSIQVSQGKNPSSIGIFSAKQNTSDQASTFIRSPSL